MIRKTFGFQVAAIAAFVAILVLLGQWSGKGPAQNPPGHGVSSSTQRTESATPLWSPGPEGDPRANAAHHWQKHGGEFRELHSEADYTRAAHDFVNHPPPGALTKQDSRGDTLIYDPGTNTFAVRSRDGAPRTMFRPRNGRAYWERQP